MFYHCNIYFIFNVECVSEWDQLVTRFTSDTFCNIHCGTVGGSVFVEPICYSIWLPCNIMSTVEVILSALTFLVLRHHLTSSGQLPQSSRNLPRCPITGLEAGTPWQTYIRSSQRFIGYRSKSRGQLSCPACYAPLEAFYHVRVVYLSP